MESNEKNAVQVVATSANVNENNKPANNAKPPQEGEKLQPLRDMVSAQTFDKVEKLIAKEVANYAKRMAQELARPTQAIRVLFDYLKEDTTDPETPKWREKIAVILGKKSLTFSSDERGDFFKWMRANAPATNAKGEFLTRAKVGENLYKYEVCETFTPAKILRQAFGWWLAKPAPRKYEVGKFYTAKGIEVAEKTARPIVDAYENAKELAKLHKEVEKGERAKITLSEK